MGEISRAFETAPLSNVVQTSLDFSARVLNPFQTSDSSSLAFAAVALFLSGFFSLAGPDEEETALERTDLEAPFLPLSMLNAQPLEANEILEQSFMKSVNRKGLFHSKDGINLVKAATQTKKGASLRDYEKALIAFEDFMEWCQNETRTHHILEDVLQLAISKTKGVPDPSDEFFKLSGIIIHDVLDKIEAGYDYYF